MTKHGRERWLVDLREFGAGRRFFESKTAAWTFQVETMAEADRYGRVAFDMPHETRTRYLALETRLAAQGATLEQAVEYWERTHRPAAQRGIAEAVAACLSAKLAAGRRERAVDQLRYSLESFTRTIGPGINCSEIQPKTVSEWLENAKWGPRTRKGRLIDLRTFLAFCRRQGWLVGDPTSAVEPITLDEHPPGILTVDQVRRLLDACRRVSPRFLPFMTLGIFAGVRPEEIKQLTWQQVNLESGYVEIPAHIAKRVRGGGGRQRRLIKLQPSALEWLRLGGDLPPVSWQDQFDRVRRAAGFRANARGRKGKRKVTKGEPWPKNAMRHSFCSYALPVFGELKESEWAGHSPQIALSRYRELVTEEAAREFWGITPTTAG